VSELSWVRSARSIRASNVPSLFARLQYGQGFDCTKGVPFVLLELFDIFLPVELQLL
jgi:hypothetical protein